MNRASISLPSARQRQRGVTLVELLVAMAIGLVVILAVTSTVIFGESQRRTTTGGNDMSQSGAFAAYAFDQALRSAGSGFVQSAGYGGLGCKLNVSYGGNVTQPRSAPFPAPFAGFVPGAVSDLRMAPVVIGKNQSAGGSDVLMVMGGNAASGAVPRPVRSAGAGTNELRLDNTVGLMPNELGLLIQPGAPTICVVEQVGSGALGKEVVTLADNTPDTYLATSAGGSSLSAIAGSTTALYTTLGTPRPAMRSSSCSASMPTGNFSATTCCARPRPVRQPPKTRPAARSRRSSTASASCTRSTASTPHRRPTASSMPGSIPQARPGAQRRSWPTRCRSAGSSRCASRS